MEKSLIVDPNTKYDKIYFSSPTPESLEQLKIALEFFLIYDESKIEFLPRKEETSSTSIKEYCIEVEQNIKEGILKNQLTENSIIIVEQTGIFEDKDTDQKEFKENNSGIYLTQYQQEKQFKFFTKGKGSRLPGIEENHSEIENSQTTGVALKLAIGKIYFNWQIEKYEDFPLKGNYFEDWLRLMCQGPKFYLMTDIFQLEIETALYNKKADFDVICAIGARGFIWGSTLSYAMRKGLCLLRKKGKLPGDKFGQKYAVWGEEQEVEVCQGLLTPGSKVLLVDDYIESGGTNLACIDLLKKAGVDIAAYCTFRMREDRWNEVLEKTEGYIGIYVV